ncbi:MULTISPECIES: hypothetical protein [Nostocales]|uniref:Transposase n=2 Tax=Nostocales TaxID=1161 RepID=A0ABW8WS78_9CYAN|nr:hypothetical protein [Tolypothrix bouteillei]
MIAIFLRQKHDKISLRPIYQKLSQKVYLFGEWYRAAIVAIHQLPPTEETHG